MGQFCSLETSLATLEMLLKGTEWEGAPSAINTLCNAGGLRDKDFAIPPKGQHGEEKKSPAVGGRDLGQQRAPPWVGGSRLSCSPSSWSSPGAARRVSCMCRVSCAQSPATASRRKTPDGETAKASSSPL